MSAAPVPRLLLSYASVLGRSFTPSSGDRILRETTAIEADEGVTAELKQFLELDPGGSAASDRPWCAMSPTVGRPIGAARSSTAELAGRWSGWPSGRVDSVADPLSLHFFEGGDSRERGATLAFPATVDDASDAEH